MDNLANKSSKSGKSPKLVGVYVRPREEHWAELLRSAESANALLADGGFAPTEVALPRSRILPVYETETGERVTLEATSSGFETKPLTRSARLEPLVSGGMAGGFLSLGDAPPLPMAGGARPADWTSGYVSRVPEHMGLEALQPQWAEHTTNYTAAVDEKTSPDQDEWRRRYFQRIRETAAARDPVYRSADAVAKGPSHFVKNSNWGKTEYHQDLFTDYAAAADTDRKNTAEARTAAPRGTFAHSPASQMLALAAALQKNGLGFSSTFFQMAGPSAATQISAALQGYLQEQAKASSGKGRPMERFQGALELLSQLNQAGGGALLAGLLDNALTKANGKGSNLDKLKAEFIKILAEKGLNQGIENLLGKDAASLLAGTGITGLFADAAKNLLMGKDSGLADGFDKLLDDLPNKLIDMGFDKLLGQVDDRSSMAKQLLAKYKDQIKGLLKKLLSEDGLADLQKQWDAIWKGIPSSASVMVGLAIGFCEPDLVMVNGLPVTRLGDECIYPSPEPPGIFLVLHG
ncbi:MAG TPA: hypothetical protein VNT79_13955, partial [Phycisphaerae bacterium]|nr:hypothetical protein [Phycisphaerae bacterium]